MQIIIIYKTIIINLLNMKEIINNKQVINYSIQIIMDKIKKLH